LAASPPLRWAVVEENSGDKLKFRREEVHFTNRQLNFGKKTKFASVTTRIIFPGSLNSTFVKRCCLYPQEINSTSSKYLDHRVVEPF
jgi:hypothetical protein